MEVGGGFDMLRGVRVLDLTGSIAGPYATMLLADMGAEVLKIERPGTGDDTRSWGPPFLDGEALWFQSVNRNKSSVALDYTSAEGLDILKELTKVSDVVVANLLPASAKKFKVDADSLRAVKPDLIYVSITGFGLEGERAGWACYDLIAEGYSGVMDLTGEVDGGPQKVGAPAADMLAGSDAAYATVAALFARQRDRQGRVVDIALVDSMTRFLACRIMPYLGSGEVPRRSGGKDSVIAIYQAFDTADKPITLALGNDNIWQRFWQVVGQSGSRGATEICHEFGSPRAPSGIGEPDPRPAEAEDPKSLARYVSAGANPGGSDQSRRRGGRRYRASERGLFYRLRSDGTRLTAGRLRDLARREAQPTPPAPPRLGEHTTEILRSLLGYDEAAIEALKRAKAI